MAIFSIIRRITRYHLTIQASVSKTKDEEENAKKNLKRYTNILNSRKRFVTISILLVSIVGTTPAFTLYMASIFYRRVNLVLFIVNMLVGRTSFNIIPLLDAIAFCRHHDIKKITLKVFQFEKAASPSDGSRSWGDYGRRKSLTSMSNL